MYLKKNKKTEFIFIISLIQILLIISLIPSFSYAINQGVFSNQNSSGYENSPNSFKKLSSLLKGFLSIKQIQIVSAQEDALNLNCCLKTNNGAICQDITPEFSSSANGCENPLPTSCSKSALCVTGTCVFDEGLSCSANSPKGECENNGGVWKSGATAEILECQKGACVLGRNIQLTTEKQCKLLSESSGIEMDFRAGLSEFEFSGISESLSEGACLLDEGNCRFTTLNECDSMGGNNFYEDVLCTNTNLETNCQPTEKTALSENKIYFIDSCGNLANIYDSSKINPDENSDYWSFISESECILDLEDEDSIKSCGNCNVFLSSQGVDASPGEVYYGDYVCKDLRCTDSKGEVRKNGERWCEYDGYIGDGKDTVGSEHWLASCNNGDVKINSCGNYRGGICEQRIIEERGDTFSTAACVVNRAIECINYNGDENRMVESCNENPQCIIKEIDIGENFKFDICTPKYPKGFDSREGQIDNEILCSLASQTCVVTYQKNFLGKWKCKDNCGCEKKAFGEKMNDLCISLGDCGSYVNYIGKGTDNIQLTNSPNIPWTTYTSYANPVEGQYVELSEEIYPLLSGIDDVISQDFPEELDVSTLTIVASGAGAVSYAAGLYFSSQLKAALAKEVTAGAVATVTEATAAATADALATAAAEATAVEASLATAKAFTGAAASFAIGLYVGTLIAKSLGISGAAAEILTISSGVAATTAYFQYLNTDVLAEFLQAGNPYVMVVAIIVIAIIAILGIGKTKEVVVDFSCLPWQAPTGGSECEKCNDPGKPCTKYRCQSLGQACELLNENTENPICQSLQSESNPPVLSLGEVLTEGYDFQNENIGNVEIRKENGECIQEFVPVEFTLKTDEFSQCKWSLEPTALYESMTTYAAEGTRYSLEHTFGIEGLSLGLLEENEISGDLIQGFIGNLNMYIKCQDYFGNFNFKEYAVNFCINSGPDKTPVFQSLTVTQPKNGKVLKHGTNEVDLKMWVNEPAECKYSFVEGKDYDEMENSMTCKTNLEDRELNGWPCETTLTDLENENNFYIKCKDQPWKSPDEEELKNKNAEDLLYTLYVTENNLEIDSIYILRGDSTIYLNINSSVSTEIRGGGNVFSFGIGIETSKGSGEGASICYYEWNNNFIPFFETNSNQHKQELNLLSGDYNIPIRCIDDSSNEANGNAIFKLKIDNTPPKVVRTYYDKNKLKIITDEQSKCYASFDEIKECNFNIEDAQSMTIGFSTQHSSPWIAGEKYYIKCKDAWENQNPSCAIIVTTSLVY